MKGQQHCPHCRPLRRLQLIGQIIHTRHKESATGQEITICQNRIGTAKEGSPRVERKGNHTTLADRNHTDIERMVDHVT